VGYLDGLLLGGRLRQGTDRPHLGAVSGTAVYRICRCADGDAHAVKAGDGLLAGPRWPSKLGHREAGICAYGQPVTLRIERSTSTSPPTSLMFSRSQIFRSPPKSWYVLVTMNVSPGVKM
jgi:hypothetical protein